MSRVELRTPWSPAEPVPLPEYPRPQMARDASTWTNLNGRWEYAILPLDRTAPEQYDGKILVPYAVELLLSGVQKQLLPDQRLWYRRTFANPVSGGDKRLLLHFGAVDYQCTIWVNGQQVGEHTGGYLPFTIDITPALIEGENELVVSVWDPTDRDLQQRGKQVLHPKGIWYTAVSGIWQTVWLEVVPTVSIESLRITPDLEEDSLVVEVRLRNLINGDGFRIAAVACSEGAIVASESGPVGGPLRIPIPNPVLWTPSNPYLYDLRVQLLQQGQVVDEVSSYFAMRSFALKPDSTGHPRFTLNGTPLFLYGPLDQGYFPDGLYTPPSEAAMVFDIEYTRRIGCNMIRKHVKIEPLRWYYHCDRLGLIVCQDLPNGGQIDGDVVAVLSLMFGFHRNDTRRLGRFGRADERNRAEYKTDLQGMIEHLYNAPCIAIWVPFNESWGQFQANEIAKWVRRLDPTRLVDQASGWFDQGGGDFQSKHSYVVKLKRPKPDNRGFILSEFGGYSLKIHDHVWDEEKKFGYRFYSSPEALTKAYLSLLENELMPLISKGLAAAVYTQTTDVEIEINGFLTYDRKVEKLDAQAIRPAHLALIERIYS